MRVVAQRAASGSVTWEESGARQIATIGPGLVLLVGAGADDDESNVRRLADKLIDMRVFGDEVFNGAGCGYNMHPHHNFVICAFVLQGMLTHVNTIGKVDQLSAGDYYVFSAGAGGKG